MQVQYMYIVAAAAARAFPFAGSRNHLLDALLSLPSLEVHCSTVPPVPGCLR